MIRTGCLLAVLAALIAVTRGADNYEFGPDSIRHPGVPRGRLIERAWNQSRIFPGTVRKFWIYVPARYDATRDSPLMIFGDGSYVMGDEGAERAVIVLDNLIQQSAIPAMLAIFIDPGVTPAGAPGQTPQFHRSFEYDSLSDRYARLLIEEILPEVNRGYRISSDPNARGIAGHSSSGNCAFTAAWNRPDAFRRVVSFVGSFADLRGADIYPSLIRKIEPRPLRLFLQDGRNDQDIYAGNWYLANSAMASALEFAGYDFKFVVGEGGHSIRHGATILPDALRWVWRDYPAPVVNRPPAGGRHIVSTIVDPGETWHRVVSGREFDGGLEVDDAGAVYFTDRRGHKTFRVPVEGTVTPALPPKPRTARYVADANRRRLLRIDTNGGKHAIQEDIDLPNSILLSADHSRLLVSDARTRWVRSYPIHQGVLLPGQPYFRLECLDESTATGADGMAMDNEGYLYVATNLGIQVADANGRVVAILSGPGSTPASKVVFGGRDLRTLYVIAGDSLFRRAIRRTGVFPWIPAKLPTPVP